jgi:hypothetical protein
MTTIGMCFIYWALGVFGYQIYNYLAYDAWQSFGVKHVWHLFGGEIIGSTIDTGVLRFFLELPLSITLVMIGILILSSTLIRQKIADQREWSIRRKFFRKQVKEVNTTAWNAKAMLEEMDHERDREKTQKREGLKSAVQWQKKLRKT